MFSIFIEKKINQNVLGNGKDVPLFISLENERRKNYRAVQFVAKWHIKYGFSFVIDSIDLIKG